MNAACLPTRIKNGGTQSHSTSKAVHAVIAKEGFGTGSGIVAWSAPNLRCGVHSFRIPAFKGSKILRRKKESNGENRNRVES